LFFILKIVDLITVVVVVAIVVTISTILCEFVLLLLVGGSEFVSLLGDGELLVEGSGDDSLVALMERFHINTSGTEVSSFAGGDKGLGGDCECCGANNIKKI
jgi:hypothetical protein